MRYVLLVTTALVVCGFGGYTAASALKARHQPRHHLMVHSPVRHVTVRQVMMQVPGMGNVMTYAVVASPSANLYVERGFEPVYDYMSIVDPRYNPAMRDAGGG